MQFDAEDAKTNASKRTPISAEEDPLLSVTPAELYEREGRHAYARAAFREAIVHFSNAERLFWDQDEFRRWVEVAVPMLRIYAEWGDERAIHDLEERLLSRLGRSDLPKLLESRVHYTLGVCYAYKKESFNNALMHFRLSIECALAAEDNQALAYPILGLANVHFSEGHLSEALTHLEKLRILFTATRAPEAESGALILRGLILRNQDKYDDALLALEEAYRFLRAHPNAFLFVHVLHAHWSVYFRKGDAAAARHYLDLARHNVDAAEMPRLAKLVDTAIETHGRGDGRALCDFRLDLQQSLIFDRRDRTIRLQGRFVLRDLAFLLMLEPGRVFTKEEIANRVWNEAYDPGVHDNKIYVTVKRLRALLGRRELPGREDYIVRSKNGYCFDPTVKIQILQG